MKKLVYIVAILFGLQSQAFAWPNNLIFTLKAENAEEVKSTQLEFPVFNEKDGHTYIGKFVHPDIAEIAQGQLKTQGIHTEVQAFFRAKPLPMEDAMTLLENYNQEEETTMLTGTKAAGGGGITVVKASEVNSAYFTVQVGVYSHSVLDKFDEDVREVLLNGQYYYFYGRYDNYDKGEEGLQEMLDKGHLDAFLTGFSMGQKMSAELLKKML